MSTICITNPHIIGMHAMAKAHRHPQAREDALRFHLPGALGPLGRQVGKCSPWRKRANSTQVHEHEKIDNICPLVKFGRNSAAWWNIDSVPFSTTPNSISCDYGTEGFFEGKRDTDCKAKEKGSVSKQFLSTRKIPEQSDAVHYLPCSLFPPPLSLFAPHSFCFWPLGPQKYSKESTWACSKRLSNWMLSLTL